MSGTPGAVSFSSCCARALIAPAWATISRNAAKSSRNGFGREAIERGAHELLQRLLVGGIGVDPARVDLRFARRLQHERLDTVDERLVRGLHVPGPGPEQGLVEEILVVAVRRGGAFDPGLARGGSAAPSG